MKQLPIKYFPLIIMVAVWLSGLAVLSQDQPIAADSSSSATYIQQANQKTNADSDLNQQITDSRACRQTPSYCFDAGSYLVRVMQLTDGTEGNYNVIRFRFENVSGGTLVLAYRAHTSIAVDEFENSYFCCTAKAAPDTSATGIGINQDKDTDSQFKLEPKHSGDVTFQVWGHRARSQESPYFHYDVTIEEMDPNNPRRIQRQRAIYFEDFTATWHKSRQRMGVQLGTSATSQAQSAKGHEKH